MAAAYDQTQGEVGTDARVATNNAEQKMTGSFISVRELQSFRDFHLKPEILRAIDDVGFEHPTQVQHACLLHAVSNMSFLYQAESGSGKTTVFILATLQQLEPIHGQGSVIVLCPTQEVAVRISEDYDRFSKYLGGIKVGVFSGLSSFAKDKQVMKSDRPHIVVGTPRHILALVKSKELNLKNVKHLILDECDKMMHEQSDLRRNILEIFHWTPRKSQQVMMFSATSLSNDSQQLCKKLLYKKVSVLVSHDRQPSPTLLLSNKPDGRALFKAGATEVAEVDVATATSHLLPNTDAKSAKSSLANTGAASEDVESIEVVDEATEETKPKSMAEKEEKKEKKPRSTAEKFAKIGSKRSPPADTFIKNRDKYKRVLSWCEVYAKIKTPFARLLRCSSSWLKHLLK